MISSCLMVKHGSYMAELTVGKFLVVLSGRRASMADGVMRSDVSG